MQHAYISTLFHDGIWIIFHSLILPITTHYYFRRKTLFGNDHEDTCKSLLGLGTIFFHIAKYDLSQNYLEQTLQILKKLKGGNYLMVANATYLVGCIECKSQVRTFKLLTYYNTTQF